MLSLLLTQLDKVMLSKLVSLEQYGYYALAAAVANLLYMVITPVSQAYYPHFSSLVVQVVRLPAGTVPAPLRRAGSQPSESSVVPSGL